MSSQNVFLKNLRYGKFRAEGTLDFDVFKVLVKLGLGDSENLIESEWGKCQLFSHISIVFDLVLNHFFVVFIKSKKTQQVSK